MHPGTYATFSGPLPNPARGPPVAAPRNPCPPFPDAAGTRLEDTDLDLADETRSDDRAVTIVLRACQQRFTTATRLRDRARARSRLRWRALLKDLLADVETGVLSALERRYDRDVERGHGLPRGTRNRGEGSGATRCYRDVRYLPWGVVVELDGRAAHPEEWRERDDLRDNALVEAEDTSTLRYGWVATTSPELRDGRPGCHGAPSSGLDRHLAGIRSWEIRGAGTGQAQSWPSRLDSASSRVPA